MSETAVNDSPVKVLGTGCAKCNKLADNVKAALTQLGRDLPVEHVTELKQIAAYGVMLTPALAINGKVKSAGKMLSVDEARELLQNNL